MVYMGIPFLIKFFKLEDEYVWLTMLCFDLQNRNHFRKKKQHTTENC